MYVPFHSFYIMLFIVLLCHFNYHLLVITTHMTVNNTQIIYFQDTIKVYWVILTQTLIFKQFESYNDLGIL